MSFRAVSSYLNTGLVMEELKTSTQLSVILALYVDWLSHSNLLRCQDAEFCPLLTCYFNHNLRVN